MRLEGFSIFFEGLISCLLKVVIAFCLIGSLTIGCSFVEQEVRSKNKKDQREIL